MIRKEKIVDQFVIRTLTNLGLKDEELTKHLIIWKTFFKEVKPSVKKMTTKELIDFAGKFLIFVIHFESICVRAYRPLTGSQSTAREIISMYSSRDLPLDEKEPLNLKLLK